MRELNLDQLRTLVTAVDLGTLSAAAQALHLAQPTVSLHVSELESRLGTPLLVRGARRVQPTAAGALLVERGRRLLRDASEAADAVRQHAAGRTGRVRVGTTTNVAVYLLPQVMAAMAGEHPDIDIDVQLVGTQDGLARLMDGQLDVGLVVPPVHPLDLVVTHWRRDPMAAFVPAAWKTPKRATPQWLAAQPLVMNDATTQMHRQTLEWFAAAGLVPRPHIELNYTEAMKSMVAAGYGAAILPLENAAALRGDPALKALLLKPALSRDTAVVHRALPLLDGATRRLLQVLAKFRQR